MRKQLLKARRYLEAYRPHYLGIDVDRLLAHAARCLEVVSGDAPPEGPALARAIPFDRSTLDARLVRGDEPELADGP